MSVSRFVRRLHLYLGIALVPWFFMYALGAVVLNHGKLFGSFCKLEGPEWTVRLEREYHRPVPESGDLKPLAQEMLQDFALADRPFWINKLNNKQLIVHTYKFLSTTELVYLLDEQRVQVKDRVFRWDSFLAGMHERGGFQHAGWLTKAWAVIVDLVGVAVLTWAVSGLYVWWTSQQRRIAGGVVLAAGGICFAILVAIL